MIPNARRREARQPRPDGVHADVAPSEDIDEDLEIDEYEVEADRANGRVFVNPGTYSYVGPDE